MTPAAPRPADDRSASLTEAERLARQRRRAAARLHHPDLGGDPDAFIAAMRELDRTTPAGTGSNLDVRTTVRSRTTRGARRRAKRLVRTARGRLPRSVPGARRYGEL